MVSELVKHGFDLEESDAVRGVVNPARRPLSFRPEASLEGAHRRRPRLVVKASTTAGWANRATQSCLGRARPSDHRAADERGAG